MTWIKTEAGDHSFKVQADHEETHRKNAYAQLNIANAIRSKS